MLLNLWYKYLFPRKYFSPFTLSSFFLLIAALASFRGISSSCIPQSLVPPGHGIVIPSCKKQVLGPLLFSFSIFFLSALIQTHNFKNHLHGFQIYINPDISQISIFISSSILTFPFLCLMDILNIVGLN